MIIDSLTLRNYRLFEEATITFCDRLSVLVGVNGAGKSSVLDAMGVLLSCYIGGFDGLAVSKPSQFDIRHVTYKSGSFYENVSQPPLAIGARGTIASKSVSWESVKMKDSPYSASPSAYDDVTQLAVEHQERLRRGDTSLVLPLISYYGTGRLWKQESIKKRRDAQLKATFGRLKAYEDCLDAHLTDTMLGSWYERMTLKYLQQQGNMPEFIAVTEAVSNGLKTLTGFDEVGFRSNLDTHELDVMYQDEGATVMVHSSQLSDGYKVALNLFADIAYRAAMLNPQLGNAVLLETEGIVLVDEIDLHLHPKWQQLVLSDLMRTFPKIQFVVTTHAPAVISSVESGQLVLVDGNNTASVTSGFYGKDANSTLREIMGVSERPRAVRELFGKFYDLVDDGSFDGAEQVLRELTSLLGNTDAELAACNVQLSLERMDLS